jgi:hypothetical protein
MIAFLSSAAERPEPCPAGRVAWISSSASSIAAFDRTLLSHRIGEHDQADRQHADDELALDAVAVSADDGVIGIARRGRAASLVASRGCLAPDRSQRAAVPLRHSARYTIDVALPRAPWQAKPYQFSMCKGADMNAIRTLGYLGLMAAWCADPATSFAAPCAGTNINTTLSWVPAEIGEGTTLATWRATSVVVSDDPNAAYHLVAGECVGTFLTTPDGNTRGSGICAREDKDGDILNEEWVQPVGTVDKGTWKNAGGTGKFSNAAGTADWAGIMSQDIMSAVRWEGDCQ